MENNSFVELIRINNLKIRNSSLIKQLSKDEVIYIHLHCCTDDDFFSDLGDYTLPLSAADFKDVKSKLNLKKVKINELRSDLIKFLSEDESVKSSEWFDMRVFESTGLSSNSAFHLLFLNLITKDIRNIFRNFDKDEISKLLAELSSYSNSKKPEYNCLKTLAVIETLDGLKNISSKISESSESILDDNFHIKELSEETKEKINEMQKAFMLCLYNNYTLCCEHAVDEMSKDFNILSNDLRKNSLQLEERNQKIKDLKENIRELNKQLKEYQKIADMSDLKNSIKNIESVLKGIENSNQKTSDEIKSMKKDFISKSYENQINNYITRVTDLKKELYVKNIEYKELKKEIDLYKLNIEDNFINYVKDNGMTSKTYDFIKSFVLEKMETENYTKDLVKDVDEFAKKDTSLSNINCGNPGVLGYVSIEKGIHYVNFSNGVTQPIADLSDKIFLSEGQFILVDGENRLIKTTNSKFEDNGISISTLRLGIVEELDPLCVKIGNNNIRDIKFNGNKGFYRVNQVVGLNGENVIARAFRTIRFNADEVINSIKARGISVYYVLDVFSGGLFKLRDIETGLEDIFSLDIKNIDVVKHAILFVRNSEVISATLQSKFYTTSNFYKDKVVYGPIKIDGHMVKLTKQSGEISLVKNIPENYILDDGDVIAVDEFNNFLYVSNTDSVYIEKSISKKNVKQMVSNTDNKKPIEKKGEVTIIGNLFYKNSYIMSFFKIGYKVNMLHGYDTSINKIIQVAKDSDAIIVNTSYCSHDNFWQIKDEVKDGALSHLKYVFTQEDGANMLVHKFKEINAQDEVAVTQ